MKNKDAQVTSSKKEVITRREFVSGGLALSSMPA
jgi:hypothetical protein